MYTIGNVMNVRGHAVQCTVFDLEGNHVRTFYFDADTKEIWCHNYYTNVETLGHNKTIGHAVPAKTKKEAEAYFKSEDGFNVMVGIIRAMTETLAKVNQMRKEAREAKNVEAVEPKPVYKHEIFTSIGSVFAFLRDSDDCTDAANWNLAEGEEYYRITLVNTLDHEAMTNTLVNLGVDYDEVITDVLETE